MIPSGVDKQVEPDGRLNPSALERLGIVMPEAGSAITPGLKSHQVPSVYAVETFVRLVAMAQSEAAVQPVS
ncbi:MAG: hypothetical protein ACRD26_13745 [Vicinamibacterales bacterium]